MRSQSTFLGVGLAGAVVLSLIAASGPASSTDRNVLLRGRWQGVLGDDADSTIVIIDADTLAGRVIAEATIPDQEVSDFPLGVDVDRDSVRFQLSRSGTGGPVLTLALPVRGKIMRGRYRDGATALPARFQRVSAPEISSTLLAISRDSPDALDVTVLSKDASELREHFNAHADRVRLVILLSPT